VPLASVDFMLGLLFEPEDGGDIINRNVRISPNYTAIQPSHRYGNFKNHTLRLTMECVKIKTNLIILGFQSDELFMLIMFWGCYTL
jgi:hypothetical protein